MCEIKRSTEAFIAFEKNYWNYYRELENEFLITRRYVEFDELNNSVFSLEYLKLFQAVCSEIDVIGKAMACTVNAGFKADDKKNNIYKWWYEIQDVFFVAEGPFSKINVTPEPKRIMLSDYICYLNDNIQLIPWKDFKIDKMPNKKGVMIFKLTDGCHIPSWWTDYNKVKHNRTLNKKGMPYYSKANFKNLCNAFAALYILEHSYMDLIGTEDDLQAFYDHSELFVKKKFYTNKEINRLVDHKYAEKKNKS